MPSRAESTKATAPPDSTIIGLPPQIPPAAKMPMGRVEAGATPPVNIGNLAPKLDDIPQPLPWPSLNAKDALKKQPVLEEASFWRTPARQAKQVVSVPSRPAGAEHKPEIKHAHAAKAIASPEPSRKTLARFIADCNRELSDALSEAHHAVVELYANAKHAYAARQIRKKIMQARQEAETRIAHLQINLSREKKIATAQSQTFSSVTAATVSAAQSAASGTRETATTTVENSSQLARKLSAPRVRIRIAAGRELIVFVERVKQAQTQWRLAIQRNSRLATSMTMAALSAVLALGLVLLVSRYQPSASAGTHAVTSSQPQQSSAAQWASTAPTESRSSKPLEPTPVPAGKV